MQPKYIDFAQLQDVANFRTILAHYGIEALPALGDELKIQCPFHEDNTPSCFVNTTKRVFNCFACGAGGNVLAFVRQMEELGAGTDGLRDAAQVLAGICGQGGDVSAARSVQPLRTRRVEQSAKTDCPTKNTPLTFRLTITQDHPFFQSHGISAEMIGTFDLGYADTGIMAGRIVIPIHNADGWLVAYAGRYADEAVPATVPRYKLPKTFHKSLEVFNLHRIKSQATEPSRPHVVIVEGFWSAMRLHLAGIPVVAVMGTTISDAQVALLGATGYRCATVLFDGDAAGRKGAVAAVAKLKPCMDVKCLDLPDGIKPDMMDADWMRRVQG